MSPLRTAAYILRYLGPGFALTRARLALKKRLGVERRVFAARSWDSIALRDILDAETPAAPESYAAFKRGQRVPFLFSLGNPPRIPPEIAGAAANRTPALAERVALLREGRCVLFCSTPSPGAIDWHANAFTGQRAPGDRAWYELPDFDPHQGDIRTLWEPSRAAWAIDLARSAARGHSAADAAQLYWRWVDSWMHANPPFCGPNWKCGQESSVRLIALALGFWALADDETAGPQRWLPFARLAWATGHRVAHHIDYAISQKNNHAISEASGLILAATLFPEFRDARRWLALGRRVLLSEVRRQFYADGSYVQHSMNYQRVALHGCLLSLRLAELAGEPFPRDAYEHVGRAAQFLFQMMDPSTGRLPNYGNNDGAYVLPLSECAPADYRPVVQAAHFFAARTRLLPPGPWDEDLLWLFGNEAPLCDAAAGRGAPQPASARFDSGGYYTLRGVESWAMIRCHTHRDRPGQRDSLHLDLWWCGQNALCDAGTYQYYTPENPALAEYFKSLAAHNTVQVGEHDPIEPVSRFLWFPWPKARLLRFECARADGVQVFEGVCLDYDRPPWRVLHRRTVLLLPQDAWLVVDDLLGEGALDATLRWHMPDVPLQFDVEKLAARLETPAGAFGLAVVAAHGGELRAEITRRVAGPDRVQGFCSPGYAELRPSPVLEVHVSGPLPIRLLTLARGGEAVPPIRVAADEHREQWRVRAGTAELRVALAPLRREGSAWLACESGQAAERRSRL
ncbi:MAG: alginate lyase family protein [Phycisphaerae bacterium]